MPLLPRRAVLIGTSTLLIALAAGCAAGPKPAPIDQGTADAPHSAWYTDVRGMADAKDNAARRAHLRQRLSNGGMTITAQPFVSGSLQGENLIADVGGAAAAPLLLIGAHSDRVDAGRGATDNASGSAAVLTLAERFKRQPLAHHRVKVAFWDLEEHGLLGATAYVEQNGEKPALYINFDVFGWGDSLWMMSPDIAHPLVAASRSAAQAEQLLISAGDQYPPSDHLAFIKAGWPAVSYSLVGAAEISDILRAFDGKKPTRMPKVMAVIHSEKDTIEQVDDAAAAKGIDAVEAAIRGWDAQTR
jgi:aminopeptidase S